MDRIILSKTLRSVWDDLGISNRDCTVTMRHAPLASEGAMKPIAQDHFLVLINPNNCLFEATHTISHEGVHVKQFLTGQMVDVPGGFLFEGKFYPEQILHIPAIYRDLPWEKEAWARHTELQESAISKLTRDEKQYLYSVSEDKMNLLMRK